VSRGHKLDIKALLSAATALIGAISSFVATPNALPFTMMLFTAGAMYLLFVMMSKRHEDCDAELRSYKWAFVRLHYAINNTPKGKKVELPPLAELFAPPHKDEEHRFFT
jgi:hypothetical protein